MLGPKDLIGSLYDSKELIEKSANFDEFLSQFEGGEHKAKTWLKYYWESYKAHPDHYFAKPLMFPLVKSLDDLFSEITVKYTQHGDKLMGRPHQIEITDPDRAFFDFEEKEYHYPTAFGLPKPELVEKWIKMWGGTAESLTSVCLININHPTKYLLVGSERNSVGHEWIAMIEKRRIQL